jgi:indolepyruvate ferredoxin oxidoreductase
MMTGAFVRDRNFSLPAEDIQRRLIKAVPDGHAHLVNATELARSLLGDTIGANLFMLGAAWQIGLIPLSETSIVEAVRLNGVAVEFNLSAFRLGRAWAIDTSKDAHAAGEESEPAPESLQLIVQDRVSRLIAYQDQVYADRYRTFVESIAQVDIAHDSPLARAVARNLFKLMAYKDEYEVARLLTNGTFDADIAARFDGEIRVTYHLAPPFLPGIDTATGRPRKHAFRGWIKPLMRGLAKLKGLRGSWADPFSYTHERKVERQLIEDYRNTLKEAVSQLDDSNYETVLALAELPDQIRGFGPVKAQAIKEYEKARQRLITEAANSKSGNLQEVSRESVHISSGVDK